MLGSTRQKTIQEELAYWKNWFDGIIAEIPEGVKYNSKIEFLVFGAIHSRSFFKIRAILSSSFFDRCDNKAWEHYQKIRDHFLNADRSIRENWSRDRTNERMLDRSNSEENKPLLFPERPAMLMLCMAWDKPIRLDRGLEAKRNILIGRFNNILKAHALWKELNEINSDDLLSDEKNIRKKFNLIFRLQKEAAAQSYDSDKKDFESELLNFLRGDSEIPINISQF